MDEKFKQEIKEKLEKQKAEFDVEIRSLKGFLKSESEDFAEDEERARAETERLEKESKLESLEKERNSVNHTLKKIESGDFGRCEKCQAEIDRARLEIMPTACLCMKCKVICDSCGLAIEEHRVSGKPLPAACQNCEEEFEPEVSYSSSTISPQ